MPVGSPMTGITSGEQNSTSSAKCASTASTSRRFHSSIHCCAHVTASSCVMAGSVRWAHGLTTEHFPERERVTMSEWNDKVIAELREHGGTAPSMGGATLL